MFSPGASLTRVCIGKLSPGATDTLRGEILTIVLGKSIDWLCGRRRSWTMSGWSLTNLRFVEHYVGECSDMDLDKEYPQVEPCLFNMQYSLCTKEHPFTEHESAALEIHLRSNRAALNVRLLQFLNLD